MEKGKETQDRMEEELDLFASWDEEEEEEAWRYERPAPYLFIESPPWEGELGANYLYYLGIRPICQGFLHWRGCWTPATGWAAPTTCKRLWTRLPRRSDIAAA